MLLDKVAEHFDSRHSIVLLLNHQLKILVVLQQNLARIAFSFPSSFLCGHEQLNSIFCFVAIIFKGSERNEEGVVGLLAPRKPSCKQPGLRQGWGSGGG